MSKALVLGAGHVARPLVAYLLEKGHQVTVADQELSKAEELVSGSASGSAMALDAGDKVALARAVAGHDITVSLLPFVFHPVVARCCIDAGKHMVTTSYVSEEMKALDEEAKRAGLTILNEVGVDPGIDHMSAMRIIDWVRFRKGRIVSFRSYCGGLPDPDSNDNPFGYKFSWAPRGVLLASRRGARYLSEGCEVVVASNRLFRHTHMLQLEDFDDFEAYPNRDSISYVDVYGLQGIDTIIRCTLRNVGWCECLHAYKKLGLLDLDEVDVAGKTYADFTRALLAAAPGEDLEAAAARALGRRPHAIPVRNLGWLGMFSDRPFDVERITPLDALGNLMFEKLTYSPGERDMIILFHDFHAAFPDGTQERITSRLVHFGVEGGDSAMARTVALPAAVSTQMILTGRLTATGVLRPTLQEIYNPVLDELATLGIECEEKIEPLNQLLEENSK
jgi:saccharopine dehydrogenase (NADP+, L-glutamate forming)